MNELGKKVIAGAVSGFISAALVDLHAWVKSEGSFNYALALKRWIAGAISGALGALGVGEVL